MKHSSSSGSFSLSFWEKDQLTQYDHLIIGAGILGLNTAIELAETQPGSRILVLERGLFPAGATTRNAGFACFAKACEMKADLQLQSPSEVQELAYERYSGLVRLRERLGDEAIGYEPLGGYELIREEDHLTPDEVNDLNTLLQPVFGKTLFEWKNEAIESFGFRGVKSLLFTADEGQIHSGKLWRALFNKAQSLGIWLLNGADVKAFDPAPGGGWEIETYNYALNSTLRLNGATLSICSNAFAYRWFPEKQLYFGRGQVCITTPLVGLRFQGAFHFDAGYYYYRNVGNRVLLGGGRNLDPDGENTPEFGENPVIQERLLKELSQRILPETPFRIEQWWSGLMGFGPAKKPVVEMIKPGLFLGFTCNGMGVALGAQSAKKLAGLILK